MQNYECIGLTRVGYYIGRQTWRDVRQGLGKDL